MQRNAEIEYMKMTLPKIKAFTIIEVVVVLVITGIVIFAAVSGYLKIQHLFHMSKNINDTGNNIGTLFNVLQYDFEKATIAKSRYNELILLYEDGKKIKYEFDTDKIEREWGYNKEIYHLNTSSISFKALEGRNNYIYEVNCVISFERLSFPIRLTKTYPDQVHYALEKY